MFKRSMSLSPIVLLCTGTAELTETRIIPRTGDPDWNDVHKVLIAHKVSHIKLVVKDHDRIAAEHMGDVRTLKPCC